uniref:Elicitin n=1 Tax=Globisporangium ultimum (strain ATCC 200006 / CBS 805.95 / DAOM BR144) TaxID=431595 RepID=K3WW74_GLOUD
MKSFAVVVAAFATLASTASAADKCVLTELVTVLQPITADVYACYDLTKYAVIPPRANPTAEQITAVCTQCAAMIETSKSITYPDCYWTIDGVDTPFPELMTKWATNCASSSSSATTTAGSSSSASSSTEAATVGTESNSTTAATSTGSESSATSATVTTPAPTTATPSSAGIVTSLSAAAAVVGSIAAFML